jgi:hypothetical protein
MSDIEPISNGEEARLMAEVRWKAVEAFLMHPELTPTAARLGAVLIAAMNAKTRECFPSEARLAAELGLDRRALQRSKSELRAKGLIDWETPYGPRGGARYSFSVNKLIDVWEAAKLRGAAAVDEQRQENLASRYTSPKRKERLRATQKTCIQVLREVQSTPESEPSSAVDGSSKAVNFTAKEQALPHSIAVENTAIEITEDSSKAVTDAFYGGISCSQGGKNYRLYGGKNYRQTLPSILPNRHYPLDHDLGQAEVGVNDAPIILPSIPKVEEPKKKRCRYPRLIEKFAPDERTADLIMGLDLKVQDQADKLRATQGTKAAAKFLEGHGIATNQPDEVAA